MRTDRVVVMQATEVRASEVQIPVPAVVGCDLISVYSESSILLSLWQATRTGLKNAQTSSASYTSDNWWGRNYEQCTASEKPNVHGLVRKIIVTRLFNLPSCTAAHTTYMHRQKKMVHHLYLLDTLPTLPYHSGRACAMGQHWIGLSVSRGKSRPRCGGSSSRAAVSCLAL